MNLKKSFESPYPNSWSKANASLVLWKSNFLNSEKRILSELKYVKLIINTNFIRNIWKVWKAFKKLIKNYIDILMVSKTKIDDVIVNKTKVSYIIRRQHD